ncbi:hypothetical protein FXO38_28117, partial [Capsicum annuum]
MCIMFRYALNVDILSAIEIWDRAIKKVVGLIFPCLVQYLCKESRVPIIRHTDKCIEVRKSTTITLIKDVVNPLYRSRLIPPILEGELVVRPTISTSSIEGIRVVVSISVLKTDAEVE